MGASALKMNLKRAKDKISLAIEELGSSQCRTEESWTLRDLNSIEDVLWTAYSLIDEELSENPIFWEAPDQCL